MFCTGGGGSWMISGAEPSRATDSGALTTANWPNWNGRRVGKRWKSIFGGVAGAPPLNSSEAIPMTGGTDDSAPVFHPGNSPGQRATQTLNGAELFSANCAGCHGVLADGKGLLRTVFCQSPPTCALPYFQTNASAPFYGMESTDLQCRLGGILPGRISGIS